MNAERREIEKAFYVEFGRQVAEARIRRGISQSRLSMTLGYAGTTLAGVEDGRRAPSAYLYALLCTTLNLTGPAVKAPWVRDAIISDGVPTVVCCEGELLGEEGEHSPGCLQAS